MKTMYYYSLVLIPIMIPFLWSFNTFMVIVFLGIYVFVYRPIIDFYRLKYKGYVSTNLLMYFFIPFYRYKWFKYLFI